MKIQVVTTKSGGGMVEKWYADVAEFLADWPRCASGTNRTVGAEGRKLEGPRVAGLLGPFWHSDGCLRYEDAATYAALSAD